MKDEKYNKLKLFYRQKVLGSIRTHFNKSENIDGQISKYGINIAIYKKKGTGLEEASVNVLKAITAQNIPHVVKYVGKKKTRSETHSVNMQSNTDVPFLINLLNVNPESLDYFLIKMSNDFFVNRYNIGIWYWEFLEIPPAWLRFFSMYNELWVATDFILNNLLTNTTIPVTKIPMVISLNFDQSITREYFNVSNVDYVFLYIFDFASMMERKNPIAIVRSFKKAFTNRDRVCLVF
ncbi:MAG: hypothetical protein ACW99Q_04275, partial [Candidatus Kariarchaeaceae archaeon]